MAEEQKEQRRVEIIENSLGSGDWFRIEIDGVIFEEGHHINRNTMLNLLEALNIPVEFIPVQDEFFA